VYSVDWS